MGSRHVTSFSTIHIDLLSDIVVTFATSHWLRSPLKAEAPWNTNTRQDGRLHSQSTRKKRRRKEEPWSNTLTAQRRQNPLQSIYITPPTQTPEWTSLIHKSMFRSRYVILKHTYRLDVIMLATRIRQLPKKPILSPNARALVSTASTKLTFLSPAK